MSTTTQLQPHQQRVVDEKAELDTKAAALSNFIGENPIFATIDAAEQERLKEQCELMWQYSETVFMNPPYSQCQEWMRKAYGSAQEGATVVCLVPSRTDTDWWHRYAMKGEIRLLRGRLKFGDATNSAPFPSAVVVFRPRAFALTAWAPEAA